MRRLFASLLLALTAFTLATGCQSVPLTGRSQVNLVSDSEMQQMSNQQYDEVLAQSTLVNDTAEGVAVRRVGKAIAGATEEMLRERGQDPRGFDWEFNLIQDNQVNAWCMPGGKIAFYTGIMPLTKDDNGIAVVMGHEVAHAIARHSHERMSHALLLQMGMTAVAQAMNEQPAQTQQLLMMAVGIGADVGVMKPFSRSHELEADRIGLILMAKAGYDPRGAVDFWTRMSQAGGGKPPEILSTHPADDRRIKQIKDYLPEALKHYKK